MNKQEWIGVREDVKQALDELHEKYRASKRLDIDASKRLSELLGMGIELDARDNAPAFAGMAALRITRLDMLLND